MFFLSHLKQGSCIEHLSVLLIDRTCKLSKPRVFLSGRYLNLNANLPSNPLVFLVVYGTHKCPLCKIVVHFALTALRDQNTEGCYVDFACSSSIGLRRWGKRGIS